MFSMSKTGTTKNRILRLIGSGKKTLSEISAELRLAPSTVSQHLKELRIVGAIEEIENEHVKKWKYYRLNEQYAPNYQIIGKAKDDVEKEEINHNMINNRLIYYIIGGIAIVALGYFALTSFGPAQTAHTYTYSGTATNVPLRLTDPPHVPSGTSSLIVTYSSLGVRAVATNGSSSWIYSNAMGSVDLMSLINISQVIGSVGVGANDSIDMARFNITSATIDINGTEYNVTVPSQQITTKVTGSAKVNASSGVLLDFSPTVAAIYTNTSPIFVLVPSLRAIVVPNPSANYEVATGSETVASSSANTLVVGQKFELGSLERTDLESAAYQNLTIQNATIVAGNNGTVRVDITVKNSGSQSVQVDSIGVVGAEIPSIIIQNCTRFQNQNCRYLVWSSGNASTMIHANSDQVGVVGGIFGNQSVMGIGVDQGNAQGIVSISGSQASANSTYALNATASQGKRQDISIEISDGEKINGALGNIGDVGGVVFDNNALGVKILISNASAANIINNSAVQINESAIYRLIVPESEGPHVSSNASIDRPIQNSIVDYRAVFFTVESNGTLIPRSFAHADAEGKSGFTIAPGASETFLYSGTITQGSGLGISFVPGDAYRVIVQAGNGELSANVTSG